VREGGRQNRGSDASAGAVRTEVLTAQGGCDF